MDPSLQAEIEYRIRHRHSDGSWAEMDPDRPHSPAEFDPERRWAFGRIFRCRTCGETIAVVDAPDELEDRPTTPL